MTVNFLVFLKSASSHLRNNHQHDTKSKQLYKKIIRPEYKNDKSIIINLSYTLKSRSIKGYKSMFEDRLLSALNEL